MTGKMKILTGFLAIFVVLGAVIVYQYSLSPKKESSETAFQQEGGLSFVSKTDSASFYVHDGQKWSRMFIKGVNLGAGKPGAFPGEVAITYEEYFRWFKYIAEMNANAIRVYTIQRPQFYNALLDFNEQREKDGKQPIYVIHGVWVNENDVLTIEDAFGEKDKILNDVVESGKEIVDIIHGDRYLPVNKGHADGTYTSDVSRYVIGWILGIEWEPSFVVGTNENNPARSEYNGKYLYTEQASPFEAFLAEVGDKIIGYESEKYKMQRALAFSNWVTTDPLKHPNEPYKNEDLVSVNVEHVKGHESFKPGMFASYHVYPYYPDTFSFQTDYINYKGLDGKPDPYLAYLEDIKKIHTMPIVVSEFGIPASRGKAHENRVTGFNQGFIDEKTQGDMLVHMINDIHAANLAGGLVFAWQDEWFKRTWNNNDLDLPDSRPYWSNPQTNEQHFGLLAFDPGNGETIRSVDGQVDDWAGDAPLYEDEETKLSVKSDEAYVYFRIDARNYDFDKDTLLLPIDSIEGQGSDRFSAYGISFGRQADFVLKIHGKNDSRLLVDPYYDNYLFRYAVQTSLIEDHPDASRKNSGLFNPIRLALNKRVVIPPGNAVIPFTGYETGQLTYGNANPKSPDYYSLSDFYYSEGQLEIRIPWQLLNVMDPSKKMIIDDMRTRGKISPIKTEGFNIGIKKLAGDSGAASKQPVAMEPYAWAEWDQPSYHERLKPSYYILQKGFAALPENEGLTEK